MTNVLQQLQHQVWGCDFNSSVDCVFPAHSFCTTACNMCSLFQLKARLDEGRMCYSESARRGWSQPHWLLQNGHDDLIGLLLRLLTQLTHDPPCRAACRKPAWSSISVQTAAILPSRQQRAVINSSYGVEMSHPSLWQRETLCNKEWTPTGTLCVCKRVGLKSRISLTFKTSTLNCMRCHVCKTSSITLVSQNIRISFCKKPTVPLINVCKLCFGSEKRGSYWPLEVCTFSSCAKSILHITS